MRRGAARLVPQSWSTDPRMGRVRLKAAILYDRMWINADDQGRLSGDPDEIKYTACPNLPDISKDDIPDLLEELEAQGFINIYTTSKTKAAQMLDWWGEQRLQWASPSNYPPPEGWTDHVRYHPTPKEIITENWPPGGLPSTLPSTLPSKHSAPLTTPLEKGNRRRRVPSVLGSTPATTTETDIIKFLSTLKGWSGQEDEDLAWLRDFGQEFTAFDLAELRAARDYYSGRAPPKHKGSWKNRLRNWMRNKAEFKRKEKPGPRGKSFTQYMREQEEET